MPFEVFTGGYSQNVGSVDMDGSWSGATGINTPTDLSFQWGYGSFSNTTSVVSSGAEDGSYSRVPTVGKDRTIKFRAKANGMSGGITIFGFSSGEFKTYADAAIFTAGLTPGVPTTTTCPVSGQVNPKTTESVGTVSMEVRVQGTSPWFPNGGAIASGLSGSAGVGVSGTLTGLNPGTVYEARFKIERNTENNTVNYSAVGTFTTESTAAVIIAPPLMTSTEQMFVPSVVLGAGSVIISSPVMEEIGEMFVPDLVFSQEVVIEKFVVFNNIIDRSTTLG